MVNGNRRNLGYKFSVWNCGRGLVQEGGESTKLNEVRHFLSTKKPHCFAIIEADIFSTSSSVNRVNKYSTSEIREILKIDGYRLELPRSWEAHGQARIVCYVSEDVNFSRKYFNSEFDHLPSISLEVGLGKAGKTSVHYYYREWKNGVTGEDCQQSQLSDLRLHIKLWTEMLASGRQFICMGDANLCSLSWNDTHYRYKDLANEVQQFLVDESCFQIVQKPTRIQSVRGQLQKSCLELSILSFFAAVRILG